MRAMELENFANVEIPDVEQLNSKGGSTLNREPTQDNQNNSIYDDNNASSNITKSTPFN